MEDKFDIICGSKFSLSEPRFVRICKVDPVFKIIGGNHEVDDSGYLGVSLTQLEALWVCKVFSGIGIKSFLISERYKKIIFSVDAARGIAEAFIFENKNNFKNDDLESAEFFSTSWWLSTMTYGFIFKSKKMKLEGIAPPGVTVCVDKVNGKVWNSEDFMNMELAMMILQ